MGEPSDLSLNGLKRCESQEIKRLKTLDPLSTTRPWGVDSACTFDRRAH